MKIISILAICLLAAGCGRAPGAAVEFKRAQPSGQKSVYALTNNLTITQDAPESLGGPIASKGVLSATVETEVDSAQPGGNWMMQTKFSNVDLKIDGESIEETNNLLNDKTFSATMDKDGNVLRVTGVQELIPGMDLRQMLAQMNPAMMLPKTPVKVGESWPIEISQPAQVEDATVTQTLKGTGTLKAVKGGQALMDFTYTMTLTMESKGAGNISLNGKGTGKSSVAFDLNKARFTSNSTDMTMETVGQIDQGDRAETIKSSLNTSLQVDLVNK